MTKEYVGQTQVQTQLTNICHAGSQPNQTNTFELALLEKEVDAAKGSSILHVPATLDIGARGEHVNCQ